MKKLAERTDFVIKNADKGEAVVIMNTYDYTNEANRQLSDKGNYKQLPNASYCNMIKWQTIQLKDFTRKISCQEKLQTV